MSGFSAGFQLLSSQGVRRIMRQKKLCLQTLLRSPLRHKGTPTQVFRDSLRDELAVQLERIDALAARADAISGVCTSRTRGRMQRYTDRIKMAYNGLVYKIEHNPSITVDALVIEADEVQSVMLSAILDLEALCLK